MLINKKRFQFLLAAMVLFIMAYNPITKYLVDQAKHPTRFIGQLITNIWSSYFETLSIWSNNLVYLPEGSTILDVGFGGGSNIKYINKTIANVTLYGIDISQESLKTAARNNQNGITKGNISLSVQDVAAMAFDDAMFDTIFVIQSHMYWNQLDDGLRQCYRTLTDHGTLVIASEIDKINYHLSEYSNHDLFKNHLQKLGFTKVTVRIKGNYVAFICNK
ncbi:class I SAM-dependent methyltransferase [Erysipelothrix sp. HDW6C]|uniref:class I SAM-dependent methyltransferase n=1 Tax=Erysipelothrix sp. HDW6C TaxID=2714930 RepID=UPI00140BBDA7|nr:class I SAM-dependent methyltransferase [Erysipelothrix sp. HDW6C]QIK70434.1 class I SAM-dependent methyltransferase [Erysipelothrix sp. HDW6C]